jgi:hypothetical protein
MTLPSFNAEQSLYRCSRHYRSSTPAGNTSGIAPSEFGGMPTGTSQAMPRFGCNPGRTFNYWWGQEIHVTPCGVQLLAIGVGLEALIPGAAVVVGFAIADLEAAAALSCDGSIYIDQLWGNTTPPLVRPAC